MNTSNNGHLRIVIPRHGQRPVGVFMDEHHASRVSENCFRDGNCAGEITAWNSLQEMFSDERFQQALLASLRFRANGSIYKGSTQFMLQVPGYDRLGWSSTAPRKYFADLPLDMRPIGTGYRARALFVPKEYAYEKDVYAPGTDTITMSVSTANRGGQPEVEVFTMYPGQDVGPLQGNMTERTGLVWFEWTHPADMSA